MTGQRLGRVVRGIGAVLVMVAVTVVPPPAAASVPAPGPVVAAGWRNVCVVRSALFGGGPACWGANGSGEVGDGTTTDRDHPVAVDTSGALNGVTLTQLAMGDGFTCGLSSVGRAYCWGDNSFGQLGTGTTTGSDVPVAVDTSGVLAGVTLTRLSLGFAHACALSTAGHLYCWGYNGFGNLGDGTSTDRHVPVQVSSGLVFTDVSVQYYSSCALAGGHAYCWGYNGNGYFGDGTTTDQGTPTAADTSGVLNGVTLTHIALGESNTCALSATGSAYCWGLNSAGQDGDGTNTDRLVPVAVTASGVLNGVTLTRIAAGTSHMCAASVAGAVYCWGADNRGQLGDGTTNDSTVPVAVDTSGALTGLTVVSLAAVRSLTCVTTLLHGVYCWGSNSHHELADGTTTDRSSPVEIVPEDVMPASPTNVRAVPGDGSATVSWDVPGSLGNGTLTRYTVTAQPGGRTCTTTGTSCVVTGLSGGTAYAFRVTTTTTVGESDPSAASTPVTVTGLAATGRNIILVVQIGAALLAAGVILVGTARRRSG